MNSQGQAASLTVGNQDLSSGTMELRYEGVVPNTFLLTVVSVGGPTSTQVFGGILCAGAGFRRVRVDAVGTSGNVDVLLDLPGELQLNFGPPPVAGDYRNIQGWYRDLNAAPAARLTNGVRVLLAP